MRKPPNKSKRNTKRYFTDFVNGKHTGGLPPQLGQGANIRFILPDGDVIQSNPVAYKKLPDGQKQSVISSICYALGSPE